MDQMQSYFGSHLNDNYDIQKKQANFFEFEDCDLPPLGLNFE